MGIFRPQKYIFMSIKLFTIFSIKCYEESHKINEWKFSCDTTTTKSAHEHAIAQKQYLATEFHYSLDKLSKLYPST